MSKSPIGGAAKLWTGPLIGPDKQEPVEEESIYFLSDKMKQQECLWEIYRHLWLNNLKSKLVTYDCRAGPVVGLLGQ